MRLTRRVISEPFMGIVLQQYPILKTNISYRLLTEYLLFGTWRDDVSGKLPIPSETIANLLGMEKQLKGRNFVLENILQCYKRDVNQTLAWSKWSSGTVGIETIKEKGNWRNVNKKARVVTNIIWPQTIVDAFDKELRMFWKDSPRVYFGTGERYSTQKEIERTNQEREEALKLMANAKTPEARELLELMNNASSLPFHKILDNIHDTIKLANEIAVRSPEKREEMQHQLKLLNAIYSQKQSFYKPTDASTRIFSIGEGLQYLDRRLRHVLTQGWIECDLSNAQLAIAAKLWHVPEVQKFLSNGGNMWKHLFDHYGLEKDDDTKQIFKTALYAMMYGMRKTTKNANEDSIMHILSSLGGNRFFKSPIIKAMYKARKTQFDKITADGGATNCFGQWLPLKQFRYDENGFSKRSILAQLSQAYEIKLLYPVVKLAKQHTDDKNGFSIVLWQHDGYSFVANRSSRNEYWTKRMETLINMQAIHLGIYTHFETKS